MEINSDLAYINVEHSDPMVLFKEWKEEAQNSIKVNMAVNSMCLATISK